MEGRVGGERRGKEEEDRGDGLRNGVGFWDCARGCSLALGEEGRGKGDSAGEKVRWMDGWMDRLMGWMRCASIYVEKGPADIYINVTGVICFVIQGVVGNVSPASIFNFGDGMNEHGSPFKLLLAHPATQTDKPLPFVLSKHPSHPSNLSPL